MTILYCTECGRPRDGHAAAKDKNPVCKVCRARPFEPEDQAKEKGRPRLRLVGAAR